MQPTLLFRPGIVIPKNTRASKMLETEWIEKYNPDSFIFFSLEAIIDQLWQSNVFVEINEACDAIIDEYETEEIPCKKLETLLVFLNGQLSTTEDKIISSFFNSLKTLCDEGIRLKKPLYFIL